MSKTSELRTLRPFGDTEQPPVWARRWLRKDPSELALVCPRCGPVASVALPGGWYAARRCACRQQVEEERQRHQVPRTLAEALLRAQLGQTYSWLGKSWADEDLTEKTFTTFDRTRQLQAYEAVCAYAAQPEGTLVLFGPYGLGKTHLLAAIANLRNAAGRPCLFACAVTLFNAIQERIGNERDYHDLLQRAISTPLLLLDDVDKPKPSEFRQEIYYQIIDGRTRTGRALALTSNRPPLELEPWIGGAVRSRLMMRLTPVELRGRDYRLEVQ